VELPGYVRLAQTGELRSRIDRARSHVRSCRLCPRACSVDRGAGELGYCQAGPVAKVYRHMAHPGEEPPISGARGSGVIFFSHCTMRCCYCQNYRMSQLGEGTPRSSREIAAMMAKLATCGCHNLNIVSGTQYIPVILDALLRAARSGVSLPVVWNTSGYESPAGLDLLDGVVDVYLADIRYASGESASRYSDASDYVAVNRKALLEMRRQVGTLRTDRDGVALRGLVVRHLVLPDGAAGTSEAMRFVSEGLGGDTFVSLMAQYYPAHRAAGSPRLGRRVLRSEWNQAVAVLDGAGLGNGWVQECHDARSPIAGTEIDPDSDGPLIPEAPRGPAGTVDPGK
jgi:putative pyruvate formate lyase activating enzyme